MVLLKFVECGCTLYTIKHNDVRHRTRGNPNISVRPFAPALFNGFRICSGLVRPMIYTRMLAYAIPTFRLFTQALPRFP